MQTRSRRTMAVRVYEQLREKILTGALPAEEKLNEETLAQAMGSSRTPVREALGRLTADGLVSSLPNHGAHVVSWSERDQLDLLRIRAMLEGYAAGLCAERIDESGIAELTRLVDDMESAAASDDFDRSRTVLVDLNISYHRAVVDGANSRLLLQLFDRLIHYPLHWRAMHDYSSERLELSMQQHRDLLSAIRCRDSEWARSIMHAHLLSTIDRSDAVDRR